MSTGHTASASQPTCPECNGEGVVPFQVCCGYPDWERGGECCGNPIVDFEECKACAKKPDALPDEQRLTTGDQS